MAAPDVPSVTVTSSDAVLDSVAVKVKDVPAFSAIDVALTVKVTRGTLSSSKILIVTDCEPLSVAPPPLTPLMAIVAVTVSVSSESSVGSKVAVPVVEPALIVISDILP